MFRVIYGVSRRGGKRWCNLCVESAPGFLHDTCHWMTDSKLQLNEDKAFVTCYVNASGRKSYGLAGRGFFGTGMTVDVFHKVGIFCNVRETWKMKWKIPNN